jgi:hypothetical protein
MKTLKTSMKTTHVVLTGLILLLVIISLSFSSVYEIPKAWDVERLHSMHLPLPDSSIVVNPVSEEYYYQLPERVAYKTYPFYMPGKEPKGYYEWLRQQSPEIVFNAADIKTDADWIKAGEIIYDMPEVYEVMDSAFLRSLPELGKHWEKFIPTSKESIIPFLSIVVREKGRIEMGSRACGMCHTKIMPDGNLLKGGQGNFIFTKYIVSLLRMQRDFQKVSDSVLNIRIKGFNRLVFEAPWIKHESQERFKKLSIEEWMDSFGTTAGVLQRQGTGLGYTVSVPDLFNLKDRKYFDRTGQLLQRDIGDLMRYAALNQSLDKLNDFNGFTPFNRPADPKKGNVTRFSEEQLFALSNYIYSLKSPKNPTVYPKSLVTKGAIIFKEQGCVTCHTPPYYSNNKLTPVDGFEIPKKHFKEYSIFDVSVETDPGLALYTRRGTGYYKVPSLIGAWNRTGFLHSGNLANLEDLFDPKRLEPDYIPTGYKPFWLSHMAVPGHPFGMELNEKDKNALVAFLKTL